MVRLRSTTTGFVFGRGTAPVAPVRPVPRRPDGPWLRAWALALLVSTLLVSIPVVHVSVAHAQVQNQDPALDDVGVDEHLNGQIPLSLVFQNENGKQVRLRDYFDGKHPVLLTFAYYTCPVLCSLILDAEAKAMKAIPWTAGKQYRAVTISIDPDDTPARARKKQRHLLAKYGRANGQSAWHFLTGVQADIERATAAAGFKYKYLASQEQYAHPAVLMMVTPDGKMARYLYGLSFNPHDVRLGLLEASKGRSITTVERIIIYCCRYDPNGGKYTVVATRVMQVGGLLTLIFLGFLLGPFWIRELFKKRKRKKAAEQDASHDPSTQVGRS